MTIPFEALCAHRAEHVYNPWADHDDLDLPIEVAGPAARLARLRAHFDVDAQLVLVGEAAGYQGCHFSGMAFTNEKLLLAGRLPRVRIEQRITSRARPWCEPSATVVWGGLHAHGLAARAVLWNAYAWHPHKPGNPHSNRTPTRTELESGKAVLDGVLNHFSSARVVAIGQVSDRTLRALGRVPAAVLRHPAMGGATAFRAGLAELSRTL
ncbi:MAG: uracil-DNA glycosylase [Pseudomonadota bacterium]|jgi:uracil-DNA glycosylase